MAELVYLSGKMGGLLVSEVLDMRRKAAALCEKFGLGYYDPAASEGLEQLDPTSKIDLGMDYETMKAYVAKDDSNLDRCTVILVLTGDVCSDGTWWEIARSYYKLNIPIVVVAPRRASGELMGFTNVKTPYIFETLEGALVFIRYGLNREGHNG